MTDFFELAAGLARREASETLSRIEAEAALTRMIAGCEAFKAARARGESGEAEIAVVDAAWDVLKGAGR